MFRTSALLLALLAGATASKCTAPMFHDFYAVSATARYTTESDTTNADFPEVEQIPGNTAEAKFGDQDAGFFNMVVDYDSLPFFLKYACMITKSAERALCTSVDTSIEEGPIMQVSDQSQRLCLLFS